MASNNCYRSRRLAGFSFQATGAYYPVGWGAVLTFREGDLRERWLTSNSV